MFKKENFSGVRQFCQQLFSGFKDFLFYYCIFPKEVDEFQLHQQYKVFTIMNYQHRIDNIQTFRLSKTVLVIFFEFFSNFRANF